jgi:hypothetical protein
MMDDDSQRLPLVDYDYLDRCMRTLMQLPIATSQTDKIKAMASKAVTFVTVFLSIISTPRPTDAAAFTPRIIMMRANAVSLASRPESSTTNLAAADREPSSGEGLRHLAVAAALTAAVISAPLQAFADGTKIAGWRFFVSVASLSCPQNLVHI